MPFQRSTWIDHPALKSASHQSAMKTGATVAYAVRSARPACRKIIRKITVNTGAVKNGINESG